MKHGKDFLSPILDQIRQWVDQEFENVVRGESLTFYAFLFSGILLSIFFPFSGFVRVHLFLFLITDKIEKATEQTYKLYDVFRFLSRPTVWFFFYQTWPGLSFHGSPQVLLFTRKSSMYIEGRINWQTFQQQEKEYIRASCFVYWNPNVVYVMLTVQHVCRYFKGVPLPSFLLFS